MLSADLALPFLEMAWSPSQMQQFFNYQVLPHTVWSGQEVTAVAIADMTHRADNQYEILYSLQCSDPTEGHCRRVVVTFAKANRLQEIYSCHYGGDGGAPTRPTPSPVVFLPESGCLVEFFPVDWQLPALAQALELGEIAPFLSQDGPQAEQARGLPTVEVVRYRLRSRRCVLRYRVDAPDGSGPQEVIGKVYPSGARAVQVAHALNCLHPQATACGLIIPKPLKVVPDRSLLLMERVPGTELKLIMKRAKRAPEQFNPEQFKEIIRLAAATLVSLHRFRFESQEVQSLQTQVEKLRPQIASLHLLAPLLAQWVEALLQQIAQLSIGFPAVAPSFVHGDFSPGQLLLNTDRMAVIDFDSASLGDPALDVGNFMAKLHRLAVFIRGAGDEFRQLATHFLSEYQARLPEYRVAERIHLFLSAALIRNALREFEMRPYDYYGRADLDSRLICLLQEAAACLSRQ